ncbi:MAG: CbtB-domain containing protein [Thermodesulfobacteriota bacterium]
MERLAVKETAIADRGRALLWGAVLTLTACGMVLVAFGPESLSTAAHDAFHGFRHAVGLACH